MNVPWRRGWRCTALSPKCRTGLCGFAVGAGLSLVLVAAPLWLIGGGPTTTSLPGGASPLAALATAPEASPQFDISSLLVGEWSGEMCPDEGEPIPVTFDFSQADGGEITYALSVADDFHSDGILGSGACDVEGEDVTFHAFLALLNDCDEACGVDRLWDGHFDQGTLVGVYSDSVNDETCLSCVGGGTWWLAPEQG